MFSWSAAAFEKKRLAAVLIMRVGVADGDDGARQDAHLDRLRRAVVVEIRGLVGDVEVDVDRLARQRRARW